MRYLNMAGDLKEINNPQGAHPTKMSIIVLPELYTHDMYNYTVSSMFEINRNITKFDKNFW